MRQITMLVPLNGLSEGKRKIEIETSGFQGTSCLDATRAIQSILGRVTDQQEKPEMYDTEERREWLNNGGDGGNG